MAIKKWSIRVIAFILGVILYVFTPRIWMSDPELELYVEVVDNLSKGKLSGENIKIAFGKLDSNVLGVCNALRKEIFINKKSWKDMSNVSRTVLIAHELYHCKCLGEHVEGIDYLACPSHFMSPIDGGEYCNRKNFGKFVLQMRELNCGSKHYLF